MTGRYGGAAMNVWRTQDRIDHRTMNLTQGREPAKLEVTLIKPLVASVLAEDKLKRCTAEVEYLQSELIKTKLRIQLLEECIENWDEKSARQRAELAVANHRVSDRDGHIMSLNNKITSLQTTLRYIMTVSKDAVE